MSLGRGLFGREAVLAAAGTVLRDAEQGAGQFLLVSGEAGIGKSSVLAALVDEAEQSGALVLRGFCWEGTGVPPYWVWSQVIRATGLSGADLGPATRLLDDSLAPDAPMNAATAADARFRLFEAVAACLRDLSEQRLVIVAIDDLHWADDPSVSLLGFLAKALAGSAVLLVGAYRAMEATEELQRLAGTSQQLALTGLTPSEVEAMVAAMPGPHPGPRAVGQLWQRSGGNPFFVRELTRLLVAHSPTEPTTWTVG